MIKIKTRSRTHLRRSNPKTETAGKDEKENKQTINKRKREEENYLVEEDLATGESNIEKKVSISEHLSFEKTFGSAIRHCPLSIAGSKKTIVQAS